MVQCNGYCYRNANCPFKHVNWHVLEIRSIFLIGISVANMIFYFAWFNANNRQSPGKRLFGIVVLDNSLQGIPFSQSLRRAIVYLFDFLIFGLGHLLILFNKKKKTFHDFVAETVVVRAAPKKRFQPILIVATIIIFSFIAELPASFLKANYLQAFRISAGGLKPTLLIGDFVLVDKYSTAKPKSSDLIVFKFPRNENLEYIKRCIALPGDTVVIKEGVVQVNGKKETLELVTKKYDLEEGHYVLEYEASWSGNRAYRIRHYAADSLSGFSEYYGPVVVPQHSYFVMGDNRDNSSDSRVWGFVPEGNIIGKAGIIYWSWDRTRQWIKKVRWSRIGMKVL